jgi:hypothetical protein
VQTGIIEDTILNHIDVCNTTIKALERHLTERGAVLDDRYIAALQAKSTALIALSNTKAVRINRT